MPLILAMDYEHFVRLIPAILLKGQGHLMLIEGEHSLEPGISVTQ
jgi:hypothetical protein